MSSNSDKKFAKVFIIFVMSLITLVFALMTVFMLSMLKVAVSKAQSDTLIPPLEFVVDQANTLKPEEKQQLTEKLRTFKEQTSNEMAILIVPTTEPETIEQYSIRVAEQWKLGKKDKDNGILFTIAVNDHKMRIEVGRGLEGVLTDLASTKILDTYARPDFRNNNYFKGINAATDIIMLTATNEFNTAEIREKTETSKEDVNTAGNIMAFIIFFLVMLYRFMASTKSWWFGGVIGGVIGLMLCFVFAGSPIGLIMFTGGGIGLGLLLDYFASKNANKGKKGGSRFWGIFLGGGSGGWGGGSGSSGGFSGGGGGFSGGGGSSSW